jgi:uncharacterized protein (TIGR00730 family)
MGLVAQATAEAGGRVVGIIPKALQTTENTRTACTELHVVDTMHERKHMMAERADVFLALPGGIGTFEEFFEVWTWRQLGYHDKPIGLLNMAVQMSFGVMFYEVYNNEKKKEIAETTSMQVSDVQDVLQKYYQL